MPGWHRRRLAETRQAILLSTWEQLYGHSTLLWGSGLTSRIDAWLPASSFRGHDFSKTMRKTSGRDGPHL